MTRKEARLGGTDPGALTHLRVLDLTSSSAAYCGKLFADLGAEVIKIEQIGADPGRKESPHLGSSPDGPSVPFLYANASKKRFPIRA